MAQATREPLPTTAAHDPLPPLGKDQPCALRAVPALGRHHTATELTDALLQGQLDGRGRRAAEEAAHTLEAHTLLGRRQLSDNADQQLWRQQRECVSGVCAGC